jgi:P-type conjugative transfer protein TrbJ
MKLRVALAGAALVVGFAVSPPARAQIAVYDGPHTYTTYLHYLGRLIEIAQKYTQIYNQYEQIYRQLQALAKLDTYWGRNVAGVIDRMERDLAYGQLPSHMNEDVRRLFEELYPGWRLPEDFWREERNAATATLDVLKETLAARHEQHVANRDHLRTVLELKNQVRTIDGTQKALEVIAGIAAFHAEATVLDAIGQQTAADATSAYFSYLANHQARQAKAIEEALARSNASPPTPSPARGWGAVPSWWRY